MIKKVNRRDAMALTASAAVAAHFPTSMARADTIQVGDATITPILDGTFAVSADLLPTLDVGAFDDALVAGGVEDADTPYMSPVNAYLIETAGRKVLIDAGGSEGFSPTMGDLDHQLAALSVAPSEIDAVLMTHLHPDHTGGLISAGRAAFPNAEIVIAEIELAFWNDPATRAALPAQMKPLVDSLQMTLAQYESRVRTFAGEPEVGPGITAVSLPGHTPGHTGYRISHDSEELLIWGDIIHIAPIQMSNPDAFVAFDVDPETAVRTRKRILDMVAVDGLRVAGMHIAPGEHRVERRGDRYTLAFAGQ